MPGRYTMLASNFTLFVMTPHHHHQHDHMIKRKIFFPPHTFFSPLHYTLIFQVTSPSSPTASPLIFPEDEAVVGSFR